MFASCSGMYLAIVYKYTPLFSTVHWEHASVFTLSLIYSLSCPYIALRYSIEIIVTNGCCLHYILSSVLFHISCISVALVLCWVLSIGCSPFSSFPNVWMTYFYLCCRIITFTLLLKWCMDEDWMFRRPCLLLFKIYILSPNQILFKHCNIFTFGDWTGLTP